VCGIVGYIGSGDAKTVIVDGLKRLEYRGYDSAGVSFVLDKKLYIFKKVGKVRALEESISGLTCKVSIGIGHTRWATHGEPAEMNAHPHTDCKKKIAVVHNGIIENHTELKKELESKGHKFTSNTDTEVIAHLVEEELKGSHSLFSAFLRAIRKLKGSYAVAMVSLYEPDSIFTARKDSPLVIGVGNSENFVASDIPAFLSYTNKVVFLNDFEVAVVKKDSFKVFDLDGREKEVSVQVIPWSLAQAEKGGYKHFMLKEIFEQPRALADAISGNLQWFTGAVPLEGVPYELLNRLHIVACGTSYHAGLVAKFYFENFSVIPVEVELASEYRYRNPVVDDRTLVVAITQSGETADTLAAMRFAKEKGAFVLSVCNVMGSTATREADEVLYTYAGPEISVASTKAFTTQVATLFMLSLWLGLKRGTLNRRTFDSLHAELVDIPSKVEEFLNSERREGSVKAVADEFLKVRNALYLGRHVNYPIALEGALKLKEISYIHAEGYPAGEMKHGPIALIDENMPVVVVATKGRVFDKILSNIEEVKARKGRVVAVTNANYGKLFEKADLTITVPEVDEFLSPIINVVPLQLLAYYTAEFLGYDVDQPRNLAKSVTVE